MNEELLSEILVEQVDALESMGYTVAYISIYGSQNYGLDLYTEEYKSDVDTKAVIVPTLDDLIKNSKPVSKVIDTGWGQCDVKDIRLYFENLLKANPSYIETLFTDHFYVNPHFRLEFLSAFRLRDYLINALAPQFIKAVYGMMCEKEKALCHPYPSTAHKIEKYGYDGKQLSHAYRLLLLLEARFEKCLPLKLCFKVKGEEKERLIDMKLNKLSLDEAKETMSKIMKAAKDFKDQLLSEIDQSKIYFSVKDIYTNISQSIIRSKIIDEISQNIRIKSPN